MVNIPCYGLFFFMFYISVTFKFLTDIIICQILIKLSKSWLADIVFI